MASTDKNRDILVDNFDRQVTYLRLSVTDRCDFRCVYCMEETMTFVPRNSLLTLEELATIARAFVELGVFKIRITGGEPLVRRNIMKLFREIGALPGIRELVTTTNGSQLDRYATELRESGVKRINISLDSLKPERFRQITRVGDLARVQAGIDAALAAGFEKLKINSVILRHRNDDEIIDLVRYAHDRAMDISFIEEMPLGVIGDHDRAEVFISSDEVRERIEAHYNLIPTASTTGGPSKYYQIVGSASRVGFISPHTHNFCDRCNRVRLTCEGRLLLCLGQEHSVDLRRVIRANPGEMEPLKQAIRDSMAIKPEGHEFSLREQPVIFRHMNVTGG